MLSVLALVSLFVVVQPAAADDGPWMKLATGRCDDPQFTTDVNAGRAVLVISGGLMPSSPFQFTLTPRTADVSQPYLLIDQTLTVNSDGTLCALAFVTTDTDFGQYDMNVHALRANQRSFNAFTILTIVPVSPATPEPTNTPTPEPTNTPTPEPTNTPTPEPSETPAPITTSTPLPPTLPVPTSTPESAPPAVTPLPSDPRPVVPPSDEADTDVSGPIHDTQPTNDDRSPDAPVAVVTTPIAVAASIVQAPVVKTEAVIVVRVSQAARLAHSDRSAAKFDQPALVIKAQPVAQNYSSSAPVAAEPARIYSQPISSDIASVESSQDIAATVLASLLWMAALIDAAMLGILLLSRRRSH